MTEPMLERNRSLHIPFMFYRSALLVVHDPKVVISALMNDLNLYQSYVSLDVRFVSIISNDLYLSYTTCIYSIDT